MDCQDINEKYLKDGWQVKSVYVVNPANAHAIILLEKETRKEKLEHLNNLSNE